MKSTSKIGIVGLLTAGMLAAAVILAGCQSDAPKISIEGARAELSPMMVGEAMVSLTIKNEGGGDALTGVKTDIPGASAVYHVMQGERMAIVDAVKIPAKSSTEFKMGGSHIMIEGMPKTVKEGSQFNVTLVFQKSGEKQVPLTLQGPPSMPMGHEHHM